jgi:hypothetical protein
MLFTVLCAESNRESAAHGLAGTIALRDAAAERATWQSQDGTQLSIKWL